MGGGSSKVISVLSLSFKLNNNIPAGLVVGLGSSIMWSKWVVGPGGQDEIFDQRVFLARVLLPKVFFYQPEGPIYQAAIG